MARSKVTRSGKEYKVCMPSKVEELCDELNPQFLFQSIHNNLLVDILSGKIDAKEAARKELQNRGLNESGEWVGFKQTND